MCVVHEAVEDRVSDATAAEIRVPVGDRQLRRDDRGAGAVAFLDGFEQVLSFGLVEGGETEVVDDDEREPGQAFEQPIVSALCPGLDELREQARQAQVLNGEARAAGVEGSGPHSLDSAAADVRWNLRANVMLPKTETESQHR